MEGYFLLLFAALETEHFLVVESQPCFSCFSDYPDEGTVTELVLFATSGSPAASDVLQVSLLYIRFLLLFSLTYGMTAWKPYLLNVLSNLLVGLIVILFWRLLRKL